MNRSALFLVILLSLVGAPEPASAQNGEPAWLVVKRAERLMDAGEFGLAIRSFRLALDLSPNDPDALYGLGRAYKAINDLVVAEDYLSRALGRRDAFAVPETALLVRYELADIHRTRRDFARYEQELAAIVAADPIPDDALIPDDPHRVLREQGLDRFLVLYRLPESGSTDARSRLAELLVGFGRYDVAAMHASVAVLQSFTTLIDAARDRDPTYEFSTIVGLMERADSYPEAREYLERSTLYHDLYYLAAALWAETRDGALPVWRLLARIDPEGQWGVRAARQLERPRVEPLLVPRR